MNKIKLNIDGLSVESFSTAASPTKQLGTVRGQDGMTNDAVCLRKQFPGGDSNYDYGCMVGLTNDEPSCQNVTCYFTCADCQWTGPQGCDSAGGDYSCACPNGSDYCTRPWGG